VTTSVMKVELNGAGYLHLMLLITTGVKTA